MGLLRLTWYNTPILYVLGTALAFFLLDLRDLSLSPDLEFYIFIVELALLLPPSMLVWGFLSLVSWFLDRKLGPLALLVPVLAGGIVVVVNAFLLSMLPP
ncbi:hypothetical protein [Aeropyrum camini]|uniref:hypothetical protein n=1 Tax=Aeropyrum camini TaxID=229980 RepID=UPI0011E5D2A8|nr:hypothetical protein [Aeropyrum camini]